MDISFGQFNNVVDASSITFKKDSIVGVDIKFDHDSKTLSLGEKITLEDKVIVNKNISVFGTATVNNTEVLTFDGGNVNSNNYAIEMNIGEKLSLDHRASNKPLYITKTNTNNSGEGATYETGVKYLTQDTIGDTITERTTISDYDANFAGASTSQMRTLQFIPTEAGKYYINYYSDGNGIYANFYIPLTVLERYSRNEQKSKDLSFNESVSIAKNLEVLGNSKFTSPSVFSDVSLNANTFVSNIDVADSSFNKLNCVGKTDLSDAFINDGEIESLTTSNLITVNRTFTVTVDESKYKLNGLWNTEVSPKIDVGETIVFNQNDSTNDAHPILILTGGTERVGGGNSDTNQVIHDGGSYTLNYYKNGTFAGNTVSDYNTNFGNGAATGDRKVEFKTTVPGTYFYQCYAHSNMGGSFTVVDPDKSDIVNKDVSFNGNIDVDFSSNYVTGVNKRMRFIFHPDSN